MARSNRRGRSDGPVPIADALANVAAQLPKQGIQSLALVQSAWATSLNEILRALGEPIKFDGQRLVVAVARPAAATQLRLSAGEVLRALNGVEGVMVDELEIVVRRG